MAQRKDFRRIGLLLPSSSSVQELDIGRVLPKDITLHVARMRLNNVDAESTLRIVQEIEIESQKLADVDVDVIIFPATAPSSRNGPEYDQELIKRISAASGKPATTAWELYNVQEDPTEYNDLATKMPDKLKEMQDLFYSEAKKYDVLPLDNSTLARWNTPRPSLTAGRTVFTYSGELTGVPASAAPDILNKGYTVTAEVEIPEGGAEGMIVTQGGRFGGYGLFLSKGEFGFDRGKVVFLYNLLDLKRTTWEGPELKAGKHTIVFDFKPEGPGLGKGGTGVLSVDGHEVARNSMDHTTPITFPEDETFDVGQDTRTGVALLEYRYDVPFKFTGKIDKLTFKLEPEQDTNAKR